MLQCAVDYENWQAVRSWQMSHAKHFVWQLLSALASACKQKVWVVHGPRHFFLFVDGSMAAHELLDLRLGVLS